MKMSNKSPKQAIRKTVVGIVIFGLLFVYGGEPILGQALAQDLPADDSEASENTQPAESESGEAGPEVEPESTTEDEPENNAAEPDLEPAAELDKETEVEPVLAQDKEEKDPVKAEDPAPDLEEEDIPDEDVRADKGQETEIPLWREISPGKYQTSVAVKLQETYTYPVDQGISVTFTKLPENPGKLAIEKISPESTSLGDVLSGVYDVTSDMADGTFAYDIEIKYKKSAAVEPRLVTSESPASFVPVEDAQLEASEAKANLNHFTYFAVIDGYDEILDDWMPGMRQEFSPLDLGPEGILGASDDNRMLSAFGWPALEENLMDREMVFRFGEIIPENTVSATLAFEYQRTGASSMWPFNNHGALMQVRKLDGTWLSLPDSLWINQSYTDEIFNIDLTPYLDQIDPNITFNFRLFGFTSEPLANPFIRTQHDWISLDVEWIPSVPVIAEPVGSDILINHSTESTQQLTGTTEPDATVNLYVDGSIEDTTRSDDTGNFVFDNNDMDDAGIVGGPDYMTPKNVYVTSVSPDGHESDPSRTISYRMDTMFPSTPDLLSPADNSFHNTEGLIMDWEDSFDSGPEASGIAGYYYESYHDAGMTSLAYRSSLLTDSEIPAPGTAAGEYWWHVWAVDEAGNEGQYSSTWHVTVDNESPIIENFELSDEWVNNIDNLTFNYKLSDETELKVFKYAIWETQGECDVAAMNAAGSPVPTECRKGEKIKRWRDDKDVLSGTYAETSGHSIDDSWKDFEDGTYMIRGVVRDQTKNKTRTARVWFGIDSTPPDVPADLGFNIPPGDPAVPHPDVELACGDYTNANFEQRISHHWTDEFASGAVLYERQWMYPGGSSWHGAEQWSTPYTNFRTLGGLPGIEGEWHVRVRAQDEHGNWSDWSAADAGDACSVTFDQTHPVVEITSPAADSALRGTVNITGTIDENIELSHYNLSLYPGDADPWDFSQRIWQQHVVGDNDTVSHDLDTTAFADGEYQIRLAARDKTGNRDPMANSGDGVSVHVIRITIDNTAPVITYDSPADGDWVNGVNTLQATCDGGITESNYVNFWWYKDSAGQEIKVDNIMNGDDDAWENHQYQYVRRDNPGPGSVVGNVFTFTLDTTDEALKSPNHDWDGEWRLRAACKDEAGNYAHAEINVNVDNTAPEVTIDSLTTTDTTPPISGTINDNTAAITLAVGGNSYTASNNGDGTWELADNVVSPLSVGTHNAVATATDAMGNVGVDSTTGEVIIEEYQNPPGDDPEDNPTAEENGDPENSSAISADSTPADGQVSGVVLTPRIGTALATGPTGAVTTAGFTGGSVAGVTGTGLDDSEVTASTEESDDIGEVKGASDEDDSGLSAAAADQINEGFAGLLKKWWFWLLVIIAAGIIIWLLARRRKDKDNNI